ncbi:PorT family protein [Panacibacter sp. DH6]|uniref:PorT family protein n=1 Tax=Panacibacter microcysteis TaxID=2793269 RepID=A0A931E6T1_9BACT|nr:porin family protein [Panacibacter microcysteis]MBG9374791.1 PorT family protein [Panacibacter microcysteis]
MKKMILGAAIITFAAIAHTAGAQTANHKQWMHTMPKFGIKGGVSLTGLSNLNGDYRTTGHGGIFVHHTLNKNWCFQPEILYAAQGQQFINQEGDKRVLTADYIQAPFMMQYFPAKKFYVEFGPQVSFLLNSKVKNEGGGDKTDVTDNYRKVDLGVNAGLGVNFTEHVGIYARYNQGLLDISKTTSTYRVNNGVQLGAAIKF